MSAIPKCLEVVLRMSDGTEIVFDTSKSSSLQLSDNRDLRREHHSDDIYKTLFVDHGRTLTLVATWEGTGEVS